MARRLVIDRLVVSLLVVVGGTTTAGRVLADDEPPDLAPVPDPPAAAPVAPYDFNGDGYPELLIGERFHGGSGGFWEVNGSWLGPSLTTSDRWTNASPGLTAAGGWMNHAYASGDFDGDGRADLAASTIDLKNPSHPPMDTAGLVQVLYGSAAGLTSAGHQIWSQNSTGIADIGEPGDAFGAALAAGDLNGDGFDDLVIGVPQESVSAARIAQAGAFHVLLGSSAGLTATGSQFWTQDSAGVPDTAETGDRFGEVLEIADVTVDGLDDVIVGIPSESLGATEDAGAVMVFPGTAAGVTSSGAQHWTQEAPGVATVASAGDRFGSRVVAGDFGGGPTLELAISVEGEDVLAVDHPDGLHEGAVVQILRGTSSGLTGMQSQTWSQASPGIAEAPELYEWFGRSLAAGDLNGDGYDDLAIGVNEYLLGLGGQGFDLDGAVHVLYGTSAGLSATSSQFWHQAVRGVPGVARGDDEFGEYLQIIDLDGDGRAELAAGSVMDWAPGEGQPEEVEQAGTVNLFSGSDAGVTTTGAQLWHRGAYGIDGPPEEHTNFGVLGS